MPTHSLCPARIQSAARDFIAHQRWIAPYAATLTLRRAIAGERGREFLDEQKARRNFRYFANMLNKEVFGTTAARHGKRISIVPVLEGGGKERLHYHAMIDCPRGDLLVRFPTLVADTWQRTLWGYGENRIVAGADDGWVDYLTKFRSKIDLADALDWQNAHLPTA